MQPINPLDFLAAFLPGDGRVLTRTGVEIHRLQYWDDQLEPWVGKRAKVRVNYDPRDITFVYVRTPTGPLVKAMVTTPSVRAISLVEWSLHRQHERALSRDPKLVLQADQSLLRNDENIKKAKASRGVQRRLATAAAGDRFRETSSSSTHEPPETPEILPVLPETPQPFAIEEIDYDF